MSRAVLGAVFVKLAYNWAILGSKTESRFESHHRVSSINVVKLVADSIKESHNVVTAIVRVAFSALAHADLEDARNLSEFFALFGCSASAVNPDELALTDKLFIASSE